MRLLVAGLLAAAITSCADRTTKVSPTAPSLSRAAPAATFDWTMPARFGLDTDADGLMDYPRTAEQIDPPYWTVNFNACQIPTGAKRTEYDWLVNGQLVGEVSTCKFSHRFATEGRYDVALHVVTVPGPGVWAEQMVTVQDWLIVSFGDSYASGEGVPEVQSASPALIQHMDSTLTELVKAEQDLTAATDSLHNAIAAKGLADTVLSNAQSRLQGFIDVCTPDSFKKIKECADYLAGLPYDTYQDAKDAFDLAVSNAKARVQSAINAVNAAQSAVNDAKSAIANLRATIIELEAGLKPAEWQPDYKVQQFRRDESCHRSANAAPARAALALEEADPRTSVTFVQVACSGAQIHVHPGNMHDQIKLANQLVGNREIDAALLSVGGDDAGFSSIVESCVVQNPCYSPDPKFDPHDADTVCAFLAVVGFGSQCSGVFDQVPDSSAGLLLANRLAELPAKYDTLADMYFPTLSGLLAPVSAHGPPGSTPDSLARLRANRVYITEYGDLTKDDYGAYCQFKVNNLLGAMPGVSEKEVAWLDTTATHSIDGAVAAAAAAHGWNYVTGIYQAYHDHGYCAQDHWVNRIYETFLIQGDISGMAHPNNEGQVHTAEAIFDALMPALYPNGLSAPPRAPDGPAAHHMP